MWNEEIEFLPSENLESSGLLLRKQEITISSWDEAKAGCYDSTDVGPQMAFFKVAITQDWYLS